MEAMKSETGMPQLYQSKIRGVVIRYLKLYTDMRGVTLELFRRDQHDHINIAMGYVSITEREVSRGPHLHEYQTDHFAFIHGKYELHLWDDRFESVVDEDKKKASHEAYWFGEQLPVLITIPPGVVHGYKNIGKSSSVIMNFPDRLYRGEDKNWDVDELRFETIIDTIYKMP